MKKMVMLFIAAGLLWAAGFMLYFQQVRSQPADSGASCEAIVVLTGSPGRVEHGFTLLEAERAPHLFITGVGDDRHSEAFLAEYKPSPALKAKVAEPGVLTIDRKATSTFENAKETQKWLEQTGFTQLCLVTAHYHMPRSLAVFRRAMPDASWTPIAIESWDVKLERAFNDLATFQVFVREYHKWLVVMLLGLVK